MIEMTVKDVLKNLKDFDGWDYGHYNLREYECAVIIPVLEKEVRSQEEVCEDDQ